MQIDSQDRISAPLSAWWTIIVLMLLSLYTIADRPLFNMLVEPIRKELLLSDFQIGLVQGLSVALFTAFVGYPIAWLADRYDRRFVLFASIGIWSTSLGLLGLSRSFEEMFIASAFVSVGEAGLVPIALAVIPELFRGQQRHLANSFMLLTGRLGSGLVVAMCGWLIVAVDSWRGFLPDVLQSLSNWRLTLLAAAVPGLLLLPLILTLPRLRSQPAQKFDSKVESPNDGRRAEAGHNTSVLPFLRSHRLAFASFYFGIAVQVFGVGCVMNFAPVIAMRQMAATPLMIGNTFGAATLVATILGFLIAQVGYRKLQPSIGPRLPAICLLGSAAFSGMVAAALLLAETPMQLFFGVGCFLTIVMAGTMLFPLALQDLTPSPIRGRMVSISVTFNIVLGSLGPVVVGAVSDQLKDQANGLMIAVVCVSCLAMIVSTLLLLPLQRQYLRTVEAARKAEIDAS